MFLDFKLSKQDFQGGISCKISPREAHFRPLRAKLKRPVFDSGPVPLWIELLVLAFLRGLLSWFFGLPLFPKTNVNISKFQLDQDGELTWKPAKADVASSLDIVIYWFKCRFHYN